MKIDPTVKFTDFNGTPVVLQIFYSLHINIKGHRNKYNNNIEVNLAIIIPQINIL